VAGRTDSTNPIWNWAYQNLNVTPNKDYTLTFWAKGQKTLYVDVLDSSWNLVERTTVKPSADYQQYTFKFNSENRTQMVLVVWDAEGSGSSFLDDFEIK
jgi:hypothetical protein